MKHLHDLPRTAADWQLYDNPGADEAARAISAALEHELAAAAGSPANMATAAYVRDRVYAVMDRYEDLGARDTEPECVLVQAIERALELEGGTLER